MPVAFLLTLASPAFAAERRYTVTDFDRIQVDGPYAVTLATGKAPSAAASGSAEALDRVSVEVEGRLLRIRASRSGWGGYPGENMGPVRITLTTPGLRSAVVAGSGTLAIDRVRAMRFDLTLSGNGRIALGTIEADIFGIGLLGSGEISVGGTAKTLRATVQGSGDLNAGGMIAQDAQINASTSGKVAVAAVRTANITANGSGDTIVAGEPACTVKALGSGQVVCGR